jgi:hypothetical protein
MRVAPTALLAAIGLGLAAPVSAADTQQLAQIAKDAYVYGYSLITTEVTRVQMTNVAEVDNEHAPMGQFFNVKRYPPAEYRGVSAPNADTLYSIVPNPLNKFTVSPRDDLQYNADGSLTLYFQHESPGKDKESNWLPAPQGGFLPMLRMYWPKVQSPSILDGSWAPPQVVRAQ